MQDVLGLRIFVPGLWLRPFMSQKIKRTVIHAYFIPLWEAIHLISSINNSYLQRRRCTFRQFNFPVRNEYVSLNVHWLIMTQSSNQFSLMPFFKGSNENLGFMTKKKEFKRSTDASLGPACITCFTCMSSVVGPETAWDSISTGFDLF